MAGATVVVSNNASIGTVTGADGRFTLNKVPSTGAVAVSYLGYVTQTVKVAGQTSLTVTLVTDATKVDDIVVVGYSTMKRGDITGSVASASGAVLAQMPVTNAAEALVGKIAGVQVTTTDGSVDADIMIRIRGGGSITQDNSPLYLLDGFPVDNINNVPVTDIESIDVLKDAAVTAIYGARGANGVVVVTTKAAKGGRTSVSFNSYVKTQTLARKLDVFKPYEFALWEMEYRTIRGGSLDSYISNFGYPHDLDIYKTINGNDWQDDIFGGHPISQYYNATISGGNDKTIFSASVTHNRDEGQVVGSGLQRTNANLKLVHNITKTLRWNTNTTFTHRNVDGSGVGGVSVKNALQQRPTNGLRDFFTIIPDQEEIEDPDGNAYVQYPPSQDAIQNYAKNTQYTLQTNGSFTWNIIRSLTWKTEYGLNANWAQVDKWYGPESGTAKGSGMNNQPSASKQRDNGGSWRLANTLSFVYSIKGTHNINAYIGQELNHSQTNYNFYSVRYFPSSITAQKALSNFSLGTPWEAVTSQGMPVRISSFFGNLNYDYLKRYYLTLTAREDGSSKFAPGQQWGFFPSAALAWRISNEKWMENIKFVNNLKVRASYGISGNNRISDNLYRQVYKVSNSAGPGFGEQQFDYYTFANQYLANPKLKWETTVMRNIGLDFSLFNERVTGTVDVYKNTTKDLLYTTDIPTTTGFSKMMSNIAQTTNRGYEITIDYQAIAKKDLLLGFNFNIGFNKNKIDKLASGETRWEIQSGSEYWGPYDYLLEVGQTSGMIYGLVSDGFYTVDDFDFNPDTKSYTLKDGIVDCSSISQNIAFGPGCAKFKKTTPLDMTSANPWAITYDDRQVIGNTNPKFSGGFGVNAMWKGFDLTLYFNFMYGFDVYNVNKMYISSSWRRNMTNLVSEFSYDNRFKYITTDGTNLRNDPEALAELNKDATIWSPIGIKLGVPCTYYVEDGSFLRLNTATIGYTLPESLTRKIAINKLRIYFTGNNLFLLTNYSGYDPEVNIQNGLTPGRDDGRAPRSRMYTCGVQINF